ncbi:hypothetical protein HNY73_022036 [Argiope bruennichi]|uniref:Uncharacterized protein n=1 Tax=Argiope bruennichi TaxID=94029 RepID=A0A8T0E3R1_ARGBR|nr:hypothetical protein HNY73_022036 [Argiope bruennichi]
MKHLIAFLIFLSGFSFVVTSELISKNVTSVFTGIRRTGRKNYGLYQPQPSKDYGDTGDSNDSSYEDSGKGANGGKPLQGGDYPNFGDFKGYGQYSNYGPSNYPLFAPNYKGFQFPSWNGNKPGDGSAAPVSPDQMMGMMMALSNMGDSSKPADTGLLTKLFSDPNGIAQAAIIPLSIVAAAFVPVLMNYIAASNAPQTVSTTANNKEARNFDVSRDLDIVMENIATFARTIERDGCIQKTVCRVATGVSNVPLSDYMKKAASKVSSLVKDDWADNLGVRNLIAAIRHAVNPNGIVKCIPIDLMESLGGNSIGNANINLQYSSPLLGIYVDINLAAFTNSVLLMS